MKTNLWRQWAARLLGRVGAVPERLRENDVVGNVSIFAYAAAAELPASRSQCGQIGTLCGALCRERGLRVGIVRQQTHDKRKRSLVSTYPPAVIREAWTHFGFAHDEPSLWLIEQKWRPLLSIYHRLNSKKK